MAQTQAAKALKVLIGGGTGFIGKHVSSILRNRGHQVRKTFRCHALSQTEIIFDIRPNICIKLVIQVTVLSRTSGPGRLTWRDLEKTDIGEFNATIQVRIRSVPYLMSTFNLIWNLFAVKRRPNYGKAVDRRSQERTARVTSRPH